MPLAAAFSLSSLTLTGKQNLLVSFILGALLTLTLPPVSLWIFLVPALSGFLWLITTARSGKEAALTGWAFGFGHFMSGTYWISIALLTDPTQFGWLIPFALFGISGVLALYTALVAWLSWKITFSGWRKVVCFALFWTLAEWLRGHLFTGFPWNLIGYSWMATENIPQLAAYIGIYGLGFLTVLFAAMPFCLITDYAKGTALTAKSWQPVIFASLGLCVAWAAGNARIELMPYNNTSSFRLRLVQANIAQDIKWQPEEQLATLQKHIELSRSVSPLPVNLVIWPESAVPYPLNEKSQFLPLIRKIIPANGFLLTGALRIEEGGGKPGFKIWNTLQAIDGQGRIAAFYDKTHLVPFGEYIPFRSILPINKITNGSVDFSIGTGPKTLTISPFPSVSPLICYEAIFPGNVVDENHRPGWIINITNDAWFGLSSGPYQHFAMVRMRAIEEGIPIVRAANTGISGIIDAFGRINSSLGLGKTGIVEGSLPPPLPLPTLYSVYGDFTVFLLCLAAAFTLFIRVPPSQKNTKDG